MKAKIPTRPLQRALSGGRTAAKVGGKMLGYYAKRPFLSNGDQAAARRQTQQESAQLLFNGLSLLKGTALKMAQQLSLEMDLLPEAACRELAKAYHQVTPINRALVRKLVRQALGEPVETLFNHFELHAFAAASLGQVHRATDHQGRELAVKVQYPGIAETIASDVTLLQQLLRPVVPREQLMPTLNEVASRLREEVDYLVEAAHQRYFAQHLQVEGVCIAGLHPSLCTKTVLTTDRMPGKPLDVWLQSQPGQKAIDTVAARLNELFLAGLYDLGTIHADPNPGNFIIADDLTIGLVDFGCTKKLDPSFIEDYRQLALAAAHGDHRAHFDYMVKMGFVDRHLDAAVKTQMRVVTDAAGKWFGCFYAEPVFDFRAHPNMIPDGKKIMAGFHRLRRHVAVNPEFIFLDRTRYGLLRLFEQMGARVCFRNEHEW